MLPSGLSLPRTASALTVLGLCVGVAALLIGASGGMALSVGGAMVSATNPARVVFEAAVLLVLGEALGGCVSRWRLVAALALLCAAGAWDSPVRRVGDGFEYLAMAHNLARGEAPSFTPAEFGELAAVVAAHGDATWDQEPMPSLRGRDGRYDFPHFWMYSLLAAPLVAVATAAGVHPALGFAAFHLLLWMSVWWLMLRVDGGAPVAVLSAALMLWWIDKAHAELFISTLTIAALLLRQTAPVVSVLLLGLVAAQMPLMLALLVPSVLVVLAVRPTRRIVAGSVVAVGLASLHPLYYLWHLGVASPLGATIMPHVPGLRALLTPVVDLNLGVVWFAPVLAVLAVAGCLTRVRPGSWLDHLPPAVCVAAMLVVAAQTPNVNHGGTPGLSRYGVWLMAVLTPAAMRGAVAVGRRWPGTLRVAVALTVLFSALVLHPRFEDAGVRPAPTRLALLVWTHWPELDNPLPEVFAERVGHVDGPAPVPVATERCEKALVVGTGAGVQWPGRCFPRTVPAACRVAGARCYANGFSVVPAPSP